MWSASSYACCFCFVQQLICFMFDHWWGSVCEFYNLTAINFLLYILFMCMYIKYMLYRLFYAMYVYKYISYFSFLWWGQVWQKHQKWLPAVFLRNIFSQGCLPAVTTQDGCGGMGEQSLFLAEMPPSWGDRRGLAVFSKTAVFFWGWGFRQCLSS